MELLSPKIDVVFKMLFSAADNKDILTDFLASVLDVENDDIKELHVVNSEMLPESVDAEIFEIGYSNGAARQKN